MKATATNSPYHMPVTESCLVCQLRNDSFFCQLPKPVLQAWEKVKHPAVFPEGAVIFVEGQAPRGVYLVCQGQVKLSMTGSDGTTLIVRLAEAGEVLGLHAAVTGQPYELTAETLHPCQLNYVSQHDFQQFLEQYGDACLHAAQHLSHDCQSAYDLIRSIGLSHKVGDRLAKLLLQWAAQLAGVATAVGPTHEEIAQLIGTSRETVTRLFADLRKKKVAHLSGSTLLIQNKPALEKMLTAL